MQRVEWTAGFLQTVRSGSKMERLACGQSVMGGGSFVVIVLGADEPPVVDVAYFES